MTLLTVPSRQDDDARTLEKVDREGRASPPSFLYNVLCTILSNYSNVSRLVHRVDSLTNASSIHRDGVQTFLEAKIMYNVFPLFVIVYAKDGVDGEAV